MRLRGRPTALLVGSALAADPAVQPMIAEVRAAGVPVGLATGISATHFAGACDALGAVPREVLFLDDSARSVAGARSAGLLAYRYSGPHDARYIRSAFQLSPPNLSC